MSRYFNDITSNDLQCSNTNQLQTGQEAAESDLARIIQGSDASSLPLNQQLALSEPPYCECARSGKRPLSWAFNVPGLSKNGLLDRLQLEFAHEHLKFDQSGDNIGFGPEGLYSEDINKYQYSWDKECLNGAQVRSALWGIEVPGYYNFFISNCQKFIEMLRVRYNQVKY